MRKRFLTLLMCVFALLGRFPSVILANSPIEDGVYYISNTAEDGYLGLGAYHNANPYIYYITDGQDKTADAYWIVTNTRSGYTFRNEASGEMLVFTTNRVDQYYKYMTLAKESLDNKTEFWNIIEGTDGAYCIQSLANPDYYWNLRSGAGLLGTYQGSYGSAQNERFVFHKKEGGSDPGPGPLPQTDSSSPIVFPEALHVYLNNGRIEAYPLQYVTSHTENNGKLVIETNIGQSFTYDLSEVSAVSESRPTDFPTFESFKFNNKFNDQLFTDAVGELVEDTVFVTISAIGKRLTPSFKVADDQVEVYVDGQLQSSKQSRLRFDKDIYYLVARKGCTMLLPESDTKGMSYAMQPYGRSIRVHVDWLTDKAEVPAIYINTADGQAINSKTTFKDAEIIIDGHGIFPSMEATPVQIKGRGNSSWSWPKKPYRLKFAEKVKPLGMTKGKSWVLLSNYQTGSLMSNAIGMKAANLMEASAANHIVPVDLYLNGQYRGSYNLTEKVGFSNNSVDLEDESAAALLELDSYYDEPWGQKFRSEPYGLPINIKEPDFSEGTTRLTLETIQSNFNSFMSTLFRGRDISRYVDIEQLVRYMMVNELTLNYEFYHPKSTFCYRESFESDTSKYIFGPVWDLDWGFGYERHGNYFNNEATSNYWIDAPNMEVVQFIRDLRFKYAPLDAVYLQLWEEFMENGLEELLEYCQDYYDFARNSFEANRKVWGDNTNYARQAQTAANWLRTRSEQIYDDLITGRRPDMPEPVDFVEFEKDKLYTLRCRRGSLVLNSSHTGLDVGQVRTNAPKEDGQFAIIGIEGNNYLYSPVTKKFLVYNNNGRWVNSLGTPITFDSSRADGKYLYMMSVTSNEGQTLYFNNSGSNLVINSWDTADDGNRWLIEEVGDFDPTEALALASQSLFAVTNRFLFNGEVVGSETRQMPKGSMPPEPSKEWTNAFVTLREPADIPYQIDGDITIDYEVEWTGPFSFSTDDKAYWYNMTIRSDYFVGKQDYEPYYPIGWIDENTLMSGEYQWAFGGNPYHVLVYNRASGFEQTLTPEGDMAVMRPGDYVWELLPNGDGFALRIPGTEYTCVNQFGGGNGPLKFWDDQNSPTDNGSTFRVTEAPNWPEFNEFSNDKLYALTCKRGELVMNAEGTGLAAGQTRTDAPEADKRFAIITYNNAQYLYSPSAKKYLRSDGSFVNKLGSPVTFDDSNADGNDKYMIFTQSEGGEALCFNNNGDIVINGWDTPDDGNRWRIEPVADFDPTEAMALAARQTFMVTYEVLYTGKVVATATEEVEGGSALPAPPASLTNSFISLKKTGSYPSKVTADVTVRYRAQWSGPFQFSTNLATAKWYNMTIRSNYYVGKQDSEPYYPTDDVGSESLSKDNFLWAFGGDPYHVLVYNRTSGFEQTLAAEGDMAVMRPGNYTWDLLPNNDGFVLRVPDTSYTCVNQYGGDKGPLKFWNDQNSPTDNGSTFRVYEAIPDGIEDIDIESSEQPEGILYDLAGRSVSSPSRGIYIRNGKKILVK